MVRFGMVIDLRKCIGCGTCTKGICFVDAIHLIENHAQISKECRGCGRCVEICPQNAIEISINDPDFVTIRLYREGMVYRIPLRAYIEDAAVQKTVLVGGDSIFVDTQFDLTELNQLSAESQLRRSALGNRFFTMASLKAIPVVPHM